MACATVGSSRDWAQRAVKEGNVKMISDWLKWLVSLSVCVCVWGGGVREGGRWQVNHILLQM